MQIDKSNKLTILFLSWRDIKSPKKGGAEVFTHEMLKLVNLEKYRIIHFSPVFEGCKTEEDIDGIKYYRNGNMLSVISEAKKFYKENINKIDYVVDQCNTHRFFTKFWVTPEKRIFFIHQLTRDIWFKNAGFPLNLIGYITETPFLKLSKNDYTMTVSESTRQDLINVGFEEEKVFIIPEGIEFEHWKKEAFLPKDPSPTFIYVGRYARYKGIDDTIKAFSIIKKKYPDSRLWIVGKKDPDYITKVLTPIFNENHLSFGDRDQDKDVSLYGFVTNEEKLNLMSRAHALIFPSLREGWGLIITEAAAVGTPSIVYNSPGTIDAVDFGNAGYLSHHNNIDELSQLMFNVIENKNEYEKIRNESYQFSLNFKWKNTAGEFEKFIEYIQKKSH